METLAIAAAIAAGACLQAATGFGFALVSAPVVFGLLAPEPGIWLLTALGLLVNSLTLGTEGRRPQPLRAEAERLLAWSVPGAVAGALLLQALDEVVLQALVTVVVLVSLALRRARVEVAPVRPWQRPSAGLATGVLNATTGTGGPPLVIFLLHLGAAPGRIRDTLTVVFLASGVVTAAVLAATGTAPLPAAGALAAAAPAAVAGHLLGRRAFRRIATRGGYEAALVLVLVASAAGGLARALG
jgi:uncharacterized protein